MTFGYDVDDIQNARCLAKAWPETGISAGLMIFGYGTGMDPDTVYDGIGNAVDIATNTIQLGLEEIAASSGAADLVFAATNLVDCCTKVHKRILEISSFAGQGIYLGGAIVYSCPSKYLLLPFGGAAIYSYRDSLLIRQGDSLESPFIHDAIGGSEIWKPQCWQANGQVHPRLICVSRPPKEIYPCNSILQDSAAADSHPNTASMLLRREIQRQVPGGPMAVFEFRN